MPYPPTYTPRVDGEIITHTKYNGDVFDFTINNLTPSNIDDHSATLAQMQLQTSPGGFGLESLATSAAGEIERLRYVIAQLGESDLWYLLGFRAGWFKGLRGQNDAATPATKYTLQADTVILGSVLRGWRTRVSALAATNDITVAGPAANGRDQAGAFGANSYVHLYLIWNGSVLATLSSAIGPADPLGPTLPTGYTHYAYACTLRLNGSTQLYRTRLSGSWVLYDFDSNGTGRVLDAGQATSFTAVSLAALVPPVSHLVQLATALQLTHSTANTNFQLFLRPTGASHLTSGRVAVNLFTAVNNVAVAGVNDLHMAVPAGAPSLDYRINAVPSASGGAVIEVIGYQVPNGAA